MNMFRLGIVALFTVTAFAAPADAGVLCKKKSGALFLRDTECRRREMPVDPATLGIPPDISVRVRNQNHISIPDSTPTILSFDIVQWDTDGMFNLGSPTRLTAKTPGKYMIYANVHWAPDGTGGRQAAIVLNGTTQINQAWQQAASGGTTLVLSTHYDLAVDDYVELEVYQDSGGPLDVQRDSSYTPVFGMVKLP